MDIENIALPDLIQIRKELGGRQAAGMAASLCLVSLCYFGIAALCAQLTGSIIALPILFFSVCVASALLDELIIAALSDFAYGYAGNTGGVLCLFSPIMGISRYLRTEGVGSVLQDAHLM